MQKKDANAGFPFIRPSCPNHDPSIVLCDLADADTLQILTNEISKFLSSCHYHFCM